MAKFSLQREIKRTRKELNEELKALGELMISVATVTDSILHRRGYLSRMEAEFVEAESVRETYSREKDEDKGE